MMVKLADGIFWCQNCGTVIKGNYKGEISTRHKYNTNDLEDVLYMYPLAPHFLPKD